MAASTAYSRLFLRSLYAEAVENSLGLEAALMVAARGQYQATKSGKVITGTSAAGRAVNFMVPQSGGVTPVEVAELVSRLLDLFDECEAALISADIATPTDAQIFAEMKSRLVPVTEATTDWSGARLGYGTPVTITSA